MQDSPVVSQECWKSLTQNWPGNWQCVKPLYPKQYILSAFAFIGIRMGWSKGMYSFPLRIKTLVQLFHYVNQLSVKTSAFELLREITSASLGIGWIVLNNKRSTLDVRKVSWLYVVFGFLEICVVRKMAPNLYTQYRKKQDRARNKILRSAISLRLSLRLNIWTDCDRRVYSLSWLVVLMYGLIYSTWRSLKWIQMYQIVPVKCNTMLCLWETGILKDVCCILFPRISDLIKNTLFKLGLV